MTNEEAAKVLRIMASGIELKRYPEIWISGFKEAYETAIKVLEERPQGKWAEIEGGYICSNCEDIEAYTPNFCPNCGAKMKGGAE